MLRRLFNSQQTGLVLVILVACSMDGCSSAWAQTTVESRSGFTAVVKKWQEVFGPVPFEKTLLFHCMIYFHPQPLERFRKFGDERISDRLTILHDVALGRIFKGQFLEAFEKLKPVAYYVNEGRAECSLLFYEFSLDDNAIRVMESGNGFFLIVEPKNFDPKRGVSRRQFAGMLLNWTRVEYQQEQDVFKSFTTSYRDSTRAHPSLPGSLSVGQVVANWDGRLVEMIDGWQDYVVGFVSNRGLCLMLFKAVRERASGGFPHDFNWLNKGLYQKDGVTLVDPPRNEFSNDPYRIDRARQDAIHRK